MQLFSRSKSESYGATTYECIYIISQSNNFYSTCKLIWAIHFDWSNGLRGVVLHNRHREYAHTNPLELIEYLHLGVF
jgi:hypothetical protein